MKTSKDKAKELVEKYTNIEVLGYKEDLDRLVAIECAKIAVDEIIKALRIANSMYELHELLNEYKEVKNELNKMP